MLINGSFVTAKTKPGDVDAVFLLGPEFEQQLDAGDIAAMELNDIFRFRRPGDLLLPKTKRIGSSGLTFSHKPRKPTSVGRA